MSVCLTGNTWDCHFPVPCLHLGSLESNLHHACKFHTFSFSEEEGKAFRARRTVWEHSSTSRLHRNVLEFWRDSCEALLFPFLDTRV